LSFEQVFLTIFQHPVFKAVFVLVVANTFIGILASVRTGTFHMDQVAEFYTTMVIPYIGGGALLQLVLWGVAGDFLPVDLAALTGTAGWGTIIMMLVWRFLRHLKALAPQLPLPIEPAVNQDTSTTAVLTVTGDGGRDRSPIITK
jgi:hypothetical protein